MNHELRAQKTIPSLLILIVLFFVLFALCPSEASAATIGRPANNLGLVGYWDFDVGKGGDTVYDRSGLGNDGTINNATGSVNWVDGKIGQGFEFDGVDDYVETEHAPTLDISEAQPFTQSIWVKTSSKPSTRYAVIMTTETGQFSGTYDKGLEITSSGLATLYVYESGGDGGVDTMSVTDIADGDWHHIVGTYDGATSRIYVDGIEEGANTFTSSYNFTSPQLVFSLNNTKGRNYFPGRIDDVRIHNRALSAGEVQRLYKLGQSGGQTIASTKTVVENGLVGHWTFDGDVTNANTTGDVSGNGNNGTLTNGPTPAIGKLGQALAFDGVDDYVDAGSPASIYGLDAVTVSMWVYYSEWGAFGSDNEWNSAVDIWDSTDGHHYSVSANTASGSNLDFVISTDSSAKNMHTAFGNWEDNHIGEWKHVVGVYDGTEVRTYVDSIFQNSNSATGTIPDNNRPSLKLGGGRPNSDVQMKGYIDDFRLYNRALTEDEIQRIYNASASEKVSSSFKNRLTDGLVGHWTFDGDVTNANTTNDVSGSGVSGAIRGNTTPTIGKFNQSFSFDGSGDYIELGDDSVLNVPSGGALSSSLWVKTTENYGMLFSLRNSSNDNPIWDLAVGDAGGTTNAGHFVTFMRYDANNGVEQHSSTQNISDGEWHHVATVLDQSANTYDAYVDGQKYSGTQTTNGAMTTAVRRAIGAERLWVQVGFKDNDRRYFKGEIDDVRLYDRALTADEVYELYNMGR